MLTLLVEPIRLWYGNQSKKLRSTHEHKAWLLQQICEGHLHEPLRKTWSQLQDWDKLEASCLNLNCTAHQLTFSPNHPAVALDDAHAKTYGSYIMNLVANMLKRTMYLWKGWTGQQARLCSTVAATRKAARAELLGQCAGFLAAQGKHPGFWKMLVHRSLFHWVSPTHLAGMTTLECECGY